jgi:hypothetical protein
MLSMATLNFFQVHLYLAPCTFAMTCFSSSRLELTSKSLVYLYNKIQVSYRAFALGPMKC